MISSSASGLTPLAGDVVAIFAIATFTLPYVSRRVQIGALTALVVALGGLLLTLRDLDGKYDGWSKVEPNDMRIVERRVSGSLQRDHPGATLPCDAMGRPIGRTAD